MYIYIYLFPLYYCIGRSEFVIHHFACEVKYSSIGFIGKYTILCDVFV